MKLILNKKKGAVQLFPLVIMIILFIGVFCFLMYENIIGNDKYSRFKNQLDASNLAVARNIDQEVLAREGKITFKDRDIVPVFNAFKEYLIKNYALDSNMTSISANKSVVGKVTIKDVRLYSVKDNKITEWDFSNGTFVKSKDGVSSAVTPNGKSVEGTSIYSKINLNTNTVFKAENNGTSNVKNLDIESYDDFLSGPIKIK